jgi:membrane-associated phospholipid phosphatase
MIGRPVAWYIRVTLVVGVGLLQLFVFYITYYLYKIIPYPGYLELKTWLDTAIPYVSWSWIIYYFGFFYITVWGALGIWLMSNRALRRTILVYVGLVLTGGVLHLLLPSDSPWPLVQRLSSAQHSFKSTCNIEPLAGFPSMHAAMSTLPTFIIFYRFKSWSFRILSTVLALLVCLSIITAREHWAIDVPAGIALGLAAGWVWRRCVWLPGRRAELVAGGSPATNKPGRGQQ